MCIRDSIKTVYLCLDSDQAGSDACSRLAELVPEGLTVHRLVPLYKDWNEVLQRRAEITDGKYIREAVYGLKEPPQEETVEIIRMSEVDTQTVESVSYTHLDVYKRQPKRCTGERRILCCPSSQSEQSRRTRSRCPR